MIEFYFQNGEFISGSQEWLLSLLNTIIGAGIGSGVAVWALYRTFRQDKIKDIKREDKESNEKFLYFKSLIISTEKDLKNQIEYYFKFSEEVLKSPYNIPKMKQAPLNDLQRLLYKIDLEKYYHSYLKKLGNDQINIEEFRKIVSMLDYFDINLKMNQKSLEKAFAFDHTRKTEYKNLLNETTDKFISLLNDAELQKKQKSFLKFIHQNLTEFRENRPKLSGVEYAQNQFVEKMKYGLIKQPDEIMQIEPLMIALKDLTIIFDDIKIQNELAATDFKKEAEKMNKHFIDFEKEIEKIKTAA